MRRWDEARGNGGLGRSTAVSSKGLKVKAHKNCSQGRDRKDNVATSATDQAPLSN